MTSVSNNPRSTPAYCPQYDSQVVAFRFENPKEEKKKKMAALKAKQKERDLAAKAKLEKQQNVKR
jgi:hypothetical protein